MQLNSGRACHNSKIETRFFAGLLQMIIRRETVLVIQNPNSLTFKTLQMEKVRNGSFVCYYIAYKN